MKKAALAFLLCGFVASPVMALEFRKQQMPASLQKQLQQNYTQPASTTAVRTLPPEPVVKAQVQTIQKQMAVNKGLATGVKFKAAAVEDTINKFVVRKLRQATAAEYEKQMDATTGRITVLGLYKVCAAAGMDIRKSDGYTNCRYFINQIVAASGFWGKTKQKCISELNGVWTMAGNTEQCVGKDGKVLFYRPSCDKKSNISREKCITTFKALKTQDSVGREFIDAYSQKNNLNLTCKSGYETRHGITSPLGQDYIQCSAGGISYEFEFDSLNADANDSTHRSENQAMCELYGGKIIKHPDAGIEKIWQSCEVSQDVCTKKIAQLSRRIDHGAVTYQGYCRLVRDAPTKTAAKLNTIPGVDGFVFLGVNIRTDQAKSRAEAYLRSIFPDDAYISCDAKVKVLNGTLDSTKWKLTDIDPDYIMTCRTSKGSVDFVFDDLLESFGYDANEGAAAMDCMISGGKFEGRHCRGLSKSECVDAGKQIAGGTRWDVDAHACILNNAATAQLINNGITIAGGVVVTVGTFGLAGAAISGGAVLAAVAGSVAVDAAFIGLERLKEKNPHHRALQFMSDARDCKNATCAARVVQTHTARMNEILDSLSHDELDVVSDEMNRISTLLTDDQFIAAMESSGLQLEDYALESADVVLLVAAIFVAPEDAVKRMWTRAGTFARKTEKFIARARNIGKGAKAAKVGTKTGKLAKSAGDLTYENKLRAAFEKYAPKNQSFDDFKNMFSSEAEFDDIVKSWADFKPFVVKVGADKRYVTSPYSTYDPDLAKKLKDIDASYTDDFAKLDEEIGALKQELQPYYDAKKAQIDSELQKIETQAEERLGHQVTYKDWDNPDLQDLKKARNDLRRELPVDPSNKSSSMSGQARMASQYPEEAQKIIQKGMDLENMRSGYNAARKAERTSLINSTVPEDVANSVVRARREELESIIASDDKLFEVTQKWPNVSDAELQDFLQNVHAQLDDVTHVGATGKSPPKVTIYNNPDISSFANAGRGYNRAHLDKKSADEFLEIIVHEESHLVDEGVPNAGMLGEQKAKEMNTLFPSRVEETVWDWEKMEPTTQNTVKSFEAYELYKSSPTEYSSWKVGPGDGSGNMMQKIKEQRANVEK